MKEKLYHNPYPTNVLLPLTINVFESFHHQSNNFLHQCVNMVWIIAKALKALLIGVAFSL
jgi:hypothetical protein